MSDRPPPHKDDRKRAKRASLKARVFFFCEDSRDRK